MKKQPAFDRSMEINVSRKHYRLLHLAYRPKLTSRCSTKHHTGLSALPRAPTTVTAGTA
jgi:hypothetical protein